MGSKKKAKTPVGSFFHICTFQRVIFGHKSKTPLRSHYGDKEVGAGRQMGRLRSQGACIAIISQKCVVGNTDIMCVFCKRLYKSL